MSSDATSIDGNGKPFPTVEAEPIQYEADGPVARIWLNRPHKRNCVSHQLLAELEVAVDRAEADDDIRGDGPPRPRRHVLLGLRPRRAARSDFVGQTTAIEIARESARICDNIFRANKPSVAVLEGYTTAGGFEIMINCDFAIADEEAKIGDFHIRRALFGGAGPIYRLPRILGVRKAKELMLTGKLLTGRRRTSSASSTTAAPAEELDACVERSSSHAGRQEPVRDVDHEDGPQPRPRRRHRHADGARASGGRVMLDSERCGRGDRGVPRQARSRLDRDLSAAAMSPGAQFDGKVAVVTGAASGIGLAIVRRLLDSGAKVVGGDLNEEGLGEVSGDLGDAFTGVVADVSSESDVEALIAAATDAHGRLDAGFNVAGIGDLAPITDMPEELWDRVMSVTLKGVFFSIKHEARAMSGNGGGAIVNVASINCRQPTAGLTAYATAKAGVDMLTRSAAVELGEQGIRVNTLSPGIVNTPATNSSSKACRRRATPTSNDPDGPLRRARRHRRHRDLPRERRRGMGLRRQPVRRWRRVAHRLSELVEVRRRRPGRGEPGGRRLALPEVN